MKSRKIKFVSALVLFLLVPASAILAQPGYGMGPRHGRGNGMWHPDSCHVQLMVGDLAQQLSLTDAQQQKILDIHYAHIDEINKIHTKYAGDCLGERDARIASRKKMDTQIKALLNADQKQKYDQIMSQRRGPHHRWAPRNAS